MFDGKLKWATQSKANNINLFLPPTTIALLLPPGWLVYFRMGRGERVGVSLGVVGRKEGGRRRMRRGVFQEIQEYAGLITRPEVRLTIERSEGWYYTMLIELLTLAPCSFSLLLSKNPLVSKSHFFAVHIFDRPHPFFADVSQRRQNINRITLPTID
jgi:hypothetical protein